jgi:hypothetical protein
MSPGMRRTLILMCFLLVSVCCRVASASDASSTHPIGQPSIFWHEGQWQTWNNGVWTPYGQKQKTGPAPVGKLTEATVQPSGRGRGIDKSTIGMGQPNTAIGKPMWGIGQPTIGVGQPSGGLGQPTIGIGQPAPGIGRSTVAIGQPTTGIGQPAIGIGKPTIGIGRPTIGMGKPTIGIGKQTEFQKSPEGR